jgi:S-adenosylmethionine:tRNA ribosyltransferase-isomerase
MDIEGLHYELPPELIAQHPAADREQARLMVVTPGADPEHRRVADWPDLVPVGALVVVNDTRVIPARLIGRKRDTGGKVEILLVRFLEERAIAVAPGETRSARIWRAMGKATKPLRFGIDIEVLSREAPDGPPSLMARLIERAPDGLLEVALWPVRGESFERALQSCGRVPLPPYIRREDGPDDVSRYQTVYARHDGAVAAPTAGLHVTASALDRLTARGCELARVTLHVGPGTFQPVQVEDLDQHVMHAEQYVVTPSAADAVARARARGAPVVAVGTTTVRALESAADPSRTGHVVAVSDETRILIQPGYRWRVIDGILTNFHLPRSTLLALVCAFAGTGPALDAYRLAVKERYRFFSYGDAMLLWRGT